MPRDNCTIAAIYDTETTNLGTGSQSRAFPCLFIVNDVRGVDLSDYQTGRDDNVKFFRYEEEMLGYVDDLVDWGTRVDRVPIICAYNLMFDLQPLMQSLRARYGMDVCAQSSTHVYTLDLLDSEGRRVLRFWDTFYLEMRGLAAMGETCGLPKASGDWDYSLVRNRETWLTREELRYAARDVQVVPAYLKYLLKANEWLKQGDLGVSVLTKTSLVRQMAKREIGNIKRDKDSGKQITLSMMFSKLCQQELPKTFASYGLRRACFRGGLTFTSARYAMQVVENVASMDVTSMHHAFINGRFVPVKFKKAKPSQLERVYDAVVNRTPLRDILSNYHSPFVAAAHMLVRFDNIRLKKGTCFEEWGIGTIPSAKFRMRDSRWTEEEINNYANIYAEEMNRMNGWVDRAKGAVFAYGKLYSADTCFVHVTEVELAAINMVYEWDGHECVLGEVTQTFTRPPDYVTLQSNLLYGMKDDVKEIMKSYVPGERYAGDIPSTLPQGIRLNLEAGAMSAQFLESYYTSTVKGQFNSIYGTMAQDVYRPEYRVMRDGDLQLDPDTQVSRENFALRQPGWCRVLYTYGMRIVGGSRLHLVIAMRLLWEKLGSRVRVTGGDTDSIKVACDADVTDDMLLAALAPLHRAVTRAIDSTMERVREEYPELASDLRDVGCFEVERCGSSTRYAKHMEAWNKARISLDCDGRVHLTCAGLSRPDGSYHMERFAEDMLRTRSAEEVFPLLLGYNTYVQPCLSFSLQSRRPSASDTIDMEVTDYRGHTERVESHESNALYAEGRAVGELTKGVNASSVLYAESAYGKKIDVREKILDLDSAGNPCVYIDGELAMRGERS